MRTRSIPVFTVAAVLIIVLLISSGCTSIPGPEARPTLAIAATPVPNAVVTINTMRAATTPAITVPPTLKPGAVPTGGITPAASLPQGTNASLTCALQGGSIAVPGQQCHGTWLIAPDTFSCCSQLPVRETSRNTSVTLEPFDLAIVMDDDPGSILP